MATPRFGPPGWGGAGRRGRRVSQWEPPYVPLVGPRGPGAAGQGLGDYARYYANQAAQHVPEGVRQFGAGVWEGATNLAPWPVAAYSLGRAALSPAGTEALSPYLPAWARGVVAGQAGAQPAYMGPWTNEEARLQQGATWSWRPGVEPITPFRGAGGSGGAAGVGAAPGQLQGGASDRVRNALAGGAQPGGAAGGAPGAGSVQGGPTFRRGPEDVDQVWYKAFQQEHDGQTPEEFYGGKPLESMGNTERNTHLGWAVYDRRWSEGFQRMNRGQAPTDDDWKAHWHDSRPGMQRPWYEGMNPGRVVRIQQQRRKWRMQRRREEEGATNQQRPPNWIPPVTYWR